MNFKVPKFLETEAKIFSFFTFKQLAIIGGIGAVLFVFYYVVPRAAFFFLVILTAIGILSFTVIKIDGFSFGQIVLRFFGYLIGSKKYFWRKKEATGPLIKLVEEKKEEKKAEGPLKVSPESKLKNLSSKIDIGMN